MRKGSIAPGLHEIPLLRVKAHAVIEADGITLIDSGHAGSLPAIERALGGLGASMAEVRRLICTHGHPDHAGSARAIADRGIEVFIHPADAENLEVGLSDVLRHPSRGRIFAAMTPPLVAFRPLSDGDLLPVMGGLRVVHTPGHTPGSVCLFAPRDGVLFVGDTLERGSGAPRTRAPVQRRSRRWPATGATVAALDVKTIIFSHYPPSRRGPKDPRRVGRRGSDQSRHSGEVRGAAVETLMDLWRRAATVMVTGRS